MSGSKKNKAPEVKKDEARKAVPEVKKDKTVLKKLLKFRKDK
uniref:Uncharacterized protein n=1 Tax=Dulem virus 29 TaxID=3145747 RepID=A0AAU8AX55_9CAUD